MSEAKIDTNSDLNRTNIQTIALVDTNIGKGLTNGDGSYDTQVVEAGDTSQLIDLKVGSDAGAKDKAANAAILDKQRAPASGMSILGVLTFGDGAIVNTTTWAEDNEYSVDKGELTYFKPGSITEKAYSALAN